MLLMSSDGHWHGGIYLEQVPTLARNDPGRTRCSAAPPASGRLPGEVQRECAGYGRRDKAAFCSTALLLLLLLLLLRIGAPYVQCHVIVRVRMS